MADIENKQGAPLVEKAVSAVSPVGGKVLKGLSAVSKAKNGAPKQLKGLGGTPPADSDPSNSASEHVDIDKDKQAPETSDEQDNAPGKPANDPIKTLGKAVMASQVLVATSKALLLANLILFLKNMVSAILAAATSLISSIIGAVVAGVQAIVGMISTAATFLGVGAAVVAFGSAGVVAVTVFSAGVFFTNVMDANSAVRADTLVYDCSEAVASAKSGETPAVTDVKVEDQAKKVYSLFKTYGLSDYNIAGITGNWSHESGIDQTGVEGIFDEKYSTFQPGSRKASANVDFNAYSISNLSGFISSAYLDGDKYYCGIGLGQFTGPRAKALIDYAAGAGKNWYDLDLQLAYCIAPTDKGGDNRSPFFATWAKETSPESATLEFMDAWEGISDSSTGLRIAAAEMWATEFASWTADVNYANSIITMSGTVQTGATNTAVAKASDKCNKGDVKVSSDNSSLAGAAVSFAYATRDEGLGNDGTPLYRTVHDNVMPGDSIYQSCDRGVASAVRWSGTDDGFLIGNVPAQYAYLTTSPKWQVVSWGGDQSKLLPGDVMIQSDICHIILYVGNEAVKAKYPNSPADYSIVSASSGERSPGIQAWWGECNSYLVFRNIEKEAGSKYLNAASSSSTVAE